MTLADTASQRQTQHAHIESLAARWQAGLEACDLDAVWIEAGDAQFYFLDDQGPRFKANAHLIQFVEPEYIAPGARLLITSKHPPQLFTAQPSDYWHASAPIPNHLDPAISVNVVSSLDELERACVAAQAGINRVAIIGPRSNASNDQSPSLANPANLIAYMAFHRATKSPWELALMREASRRGALGHRAAAQAFDANGTEFDIHMAFLAASQQTDHDLPYGNIVALNEHGATLHYQHQCREHQTPSRSLLIDAGAQCAGYASDITRTYVHDGEEHAQFRALLSDMQAHQDQLIDQIRVGDSYVALHRQMHEQLAHVLAAANLITCSAEAAFAQGITEAFCPHGLGHLLGVHVHDAGGLIADVTGTPALPPENYPSLRLTRTIEREHVFTIEPGLYFIDALLDPLRATDAPINWATVDGLRPYGGIRIEDNIRVTAEGSENLTRTAFAEVA